MTTYVATSTALKGKQTKQNIARRIHINPHSKGNLGRSFEAEFRTAWLDHLGVPWNGSDLDDRHRTFSSRHPEAVRSYQLDGGFDNIDALLDLFSCVFKDTTPVHIIDARAQADALILSALDKAQVIDACAELNIRLTFLIFPSDEVESLDNLYRLFSFAGDRVDYLLVYNPAKAHGDLMRGSQFESELFKCGAREVTLPTMARAALWTIANAEHVANRALNFAEMSQVEGDHLEPALAEEVHRVMQAMFRQYDLVADLLLPTEFIPCKGPAAIKPEAPSQTTALERAWGIG